MTDRTGPDFSVSPFAGAPEARFEPAPSDGVLPENFFSTSNLPTYVRVQGNWLMPDRPRDGLRDRPPCLGHRGGGTAPGEAR
jgi:hypothetical protein